MEWPKLQGQEIARLKEHFGSPLHLLAAFDSEDEIKELIDVYWPGIGSDGVKERVKTLLKWSADNAKAGKRRRREILRDSLETLPSRPARPELAKSFEEATRDNPLVLLEVIDSHAGENGHQSYPRHGPLK